MKKFTKKMLLPLTATFIYFLISVSSMVTGNDSTAYDRSLTPVIVSPSGDSAMSQTPDPILLSNNMLTPHVLLSTFLFFALFLIIVVYIVKDKPTSETQSSSVHYPPI